MTTDTYACDTCHGTGDKGGLMRRFIIHRQLEKIKEKETP